MVVVGVGPGLWQQMLDFWAQERKAAKQWPPLREAHSTRTAPSAVTAAACRLARRAHLDSNSLQEFVSMGLSVFTMHVMADTTPAARSFFTRARTKLGLSWGRRQLSRGASAE